MALCTQACCNKALRDAIRAQREAEFEAFLAAKANGPVEPAFREDPSPEVWTTTPEGIPTLDVEATQRAVLTDAEKARLNEWASAHPVAG